MNTFMLAAVIRSTYTTFLQPISKFSHNLQKKANYSFIMTTKSAILLIAEGTEEMEAVITADILRRAGVHLTVASIDDSMCVKCSRDIKICVDAKLKDICNQKYDAVIMPGGLGGTKAFINSETVGSLLKEQEKSNRLIAAICAAPTALKAHCIAKGKQVTSYPAMKDELVNDYKYLDEPVVIDDNLITSRGPATAFAFGLAIVEKLLDKSTADSVAQATLYK